MIVGGAQENTLLTVEGLDQTGRYEVTLACGIDDSPEGHLLNRARRTTRLLIVPELCRNIRPWTDLKACWKLYRLMRKERYHIVHTHSSKAGVVGRIAAWLAGTPIVVQSLHSLVFHDYQPWVVNRLWRIIKKVCACFTDHYVSVSRIIAEMAAEAGVAPPEKFTTIYSGMELDWFLQAQPDRLAVRRELGIPDDAPVVGKIARLFPLKGHDQLLDAAPEIVRRQPNVCFLLIGDGILMEQLQERVRALGIEENFVFAGLIDRQRIPEMLSAMDVVVHTSLREGLARVLPQSLAMGIPCVAYDLDGSPEVVIPDETGYLVQPGDHQDLAEKLARLIADPDLRKRMGEAGRRLVDPAFRAETMVEQTDAVYCQLADEHADRLAVFDARFPTEPTPAANLIPSHSLSRGEADGSDWQHRPNTDRAGTDVPQPTIHPHSYPTGTTS